MTTSNSSEGKLHANLDEAAAEELDSILTPEPVFTGTTATILNGLSGLCLLLASLALVVLVAVFGWLVFGRYVLNNTPTWVEQLSLLLVVAITFLGSATLVHEDKHLGVTFLRDMLPGRLRITVRLLGDATLAAFGATMAVVCSELVAFSWGNTLPMLGIPEGVRSLPAVICGVLIALFSGSRAIVGIVALIRGHTASSPSSNPTIDPS